MKQTEGRLITMNRSIVFPLSMTVLWSIVFASVMHSWSEGICLGLCFGMTFGLFSSKDAADGKKGNHMEKEDETDAVCI